MNNKPQEVPELDLLLNKYKLEGTSYSCWKYGEFVYVQIASENMTTSVQLCYDEITGYIQKDRVSTRGGKFPLNSFDVMSMDGFKQSIPSLFCKTLELSA